MAKKKGKSGNSDILVLCSKITVDADCSHEIKRHLLLGRKALRKLDSVLKQRYLIANKDPYSQSYGADVRAGS